MKPEAFTIPQLRQKKAGGEPITVVTCYDHAFARILEETTIDVLLVGDSLGMVVQGKDSTLPVTVDEMIYHTQCVARGAPRPLIVADMPSESPPRLTLKPRLPSFIRAQKPMS